MIEFAVVAPAITVLGTVLLQMGLVFHAKNLVNHATHLAARSGTMAHARLADIRLGLARGLVPLYGGGRDAASLAASLARATADTTAHSRIELINPTRASFDDWATDAALNRRYGQRAIPNASLAHRDPAQRGATSGQNIHDANVLKIRVSHGVPLNVPLGGTLIQFLLRWYDPGTDAFATAQYAARRIPVTAVAVLPMQSDALEPANPVSGPGGNPTTNPTTNPTPTPEPPRCLTAGCTVIVDPNPPGGGSGGGGGGSATDPPPLLECPPGDPNCTPLCPAP